MNVCVVPVCLCVCVCVIHTSRSRGVSQSRFFLFFFHLLFSFFSLCILEPQKRDAPFERSTMSAAANSAAYWRIAGMSYLKYANACAEVVRGALKEPHLSKVRAWTLESLFVVASDPRNHIRFLPRLEGSRSLSLSRSLSRKTHSLFLSFSLSLSTKARARDAVYFKSTKYVKGAPEAAVVTEVVPAELPK